jgi:hypothetical protein
MDVRVGQMETTIRATAPRRESGREERVPTRHEPVAEHRRPPGLEADRRLWVRLTLDENRCEMQP